MKSCAISENRSEPDIIDAGYGKDERSLARELFTQHYDDLIGISRRLRQRYRTSETLNTSALIHEAFLRLRPDRNFADNGHFFSAVALAMRHTLIDHARRKQHKANPKVMGEQVEDIAVQGLADLPVEDVLAVQQGLEYVAAQDPRLIRMIDCRFFLGLTLEETAFAQSVTERTVRRDWKKARALLRHYLSGEEDGRQPS